MRSFEAGTSGWNAGVCGVWDDACYGAVCGKEVSERKI